MKEEKTKREKQVEKVKGGEKLIKLLKKQNGITLIALVITIIVLIILAAVSISMLTGENGILTKANEAKEAMERANILEQIQIKVFEKQATSYRTQITEADMVAILEQYGEVQYEADGTTLKGITTSKGNYEILLTEVYQGTLVAGVVTPEPTPTPVTDGTYSETKGVNTPKIGAGLTAVTINTDGTLVNAELTSDSWYSYTEGDRRWANAKTNDGSMWVWIPRYEYKITYTNGSDKSQGGIIDVNFIPTTQTAATAGYTIHPAFTNNVAAGGWDSELAGIWIAKFEAGYAGGNNSVAQVNTGETYTQSTTNFYGAVTSGSTQMKYPVFMPKTYSYNIINIGDIYKLSKNLTKSGNPYGFDNTKTDSHMMKNSEWGAVAYLAHSKYGRNGTEITINNVNLANTPTTIYAVTGFAGAAISASQNSTTVGALNAGTSGSYSWETTGGQLASTTGNAYGIYDISGGTYEYVAGYISNGNANLTTYGGTLVSEGGAGTSTKYKTIYAYNTGSDINTNNYSMAANTGRKGEAIWETSTSGSGFTSWNADYSYFPNASSPFFIRGGNYSKITSAGAFNFYHISGDASLSCAFRPVLAFSGT